MATDDDLRTLGVKLDGLDLTDGELQALHLVVSAALGDDEVAGFAVASFGALLPRLNLTGDDNRVKGSTKPICDDDDWVKGSTKPLWGDDDW